MSLYEKRLKEIRRCLKQLDKKSFVYYAIKTYYDDLVELGESYFMEHELKH